MYTTNNKLTIGLASSALFGAINRVVSSLLDQPEVESVLADKSDYLSERN